MLMSETLWVQITLRAALCQCNLIIKIVISHLQSQNTLEGCKESKKKAKWRFFCDIENISFCVSPAKTFLKVAFLCIKVIAMVIMSQETMHFLLLSVLFFSHL